MALESNEGTNQKAIDEFTNLVCAGVPAIWVRTFEVERAIRQLPARMIAENKYTSVSWDCDRGLGIGETPEFLHMTTAMDPLNWLSKREVKVDPHTPDAPRPKAPEPGNNVILFLWNYHGFMTQKDTGQAMPDVAHAVLTNFADWKARGCVIVVVSPVLNLPIELEKHFVVLDFPLPDAPELERVLDEFLKQAKLVVEGEMSVALQKPEGDELKAVIRAMTGMTAFEAESALSLSMVKHGKFVPDEIASLKMQFVKKCDILDLNTDDVSMDDVCGMDNLKKFMLTAGRTELSKGVLVVGVPGCGKSMFGKALGNALGYPTVKLDFGKVYGHFIGDSERNVRNALDVVEAMSPVVLVIEEIEKALSGVASSHMTDGGTGARVGATYLNWAEDHRGSVVQYGTCNDITKLPPEYQRAERWDTIFFVDLPNATERDALVKLYSKKYKVSVTADNMPCVQDWSGAEIKSLFRIAAMLRTGPKEAANYIVPIIRSASAEIEALRQWAAGKTVPASLSAATQSPSGGKGSIPRGTDHNNMEVG